VKQHGGQLAPAEVTAGSPAVLELVKPAPGERNPAAAAQAAELWGIARAAMQSGRLRRLLRSEKYSVVSAVFSALFPDDFDRVRKGKGKPAHWVRLCRPCTCHQCHNRLDERKESYRIPSRPSVCAGVQLPRDRRADAAMVGPAALAVQTHDSVDAC
jgi:hypothetical protein